jgi:hypothetical protein
MPRGRCTFRQTDLTRAMKSARAAELPVERYEIERDGKIIVVLCSESSSPDREKEVNEWENV